MTLTGCGNFAIVGMSSGHIEIFNIQSGIHGGGGGGGGGEDRRPKGVDKMLIAL